MRKHRPRQRIWYYLSFADETGFKGGCYVEVLPNIPIPEFAQGKGSIADDLARAITQAHRLGINPGGQVKALGPLPDEGMAEHVPMKMRNRLLSREEIEGERPDSSSSSPATPLGRKS